MLRVHQFSFSGCEAEERGIKQIDAIHDGRSLDVVRISQKRRIDSGGEELFIGEDRDGFLSIP